MKNIILMCMMCSVLACVKVQKKSELDQPQDQNVTVTAEPVIFILDEMISLKRDTLIVADEVHFKSNARIYTNQFALDIQAAKIFIDRGVFIQTFAENNHIAPMEVAGLDGGVVHIVANDIHGNLQVFMNGQSGGEGLGGWTERPGVSSAIWPDPPRSACQPNSGKNSGASGSFFMEVNQSQDFSISTSMKVAAGGAIGSVLEENFAFVKDLNLKYKIQQQQNCHIIPKVGRAGVPGQICLKMLLADLARCEKF